ncbi:MAG: hypothetical protein FWH36_05420 [Lentimicrobiaceae bacterium]|nr:hypothetical protein [Lentimicrobiaceae bacterium]
MVKKIVFFVLGLLLLGGISFVFLYEKKSQQAEKINNYSLTKAEEDSLQAGDIILRHGFGLISDAIVKYAKSPYSVSHCGIVVKDSSDNWAVIHTVSNALADIDGMQKDNLKKFVRDSKPHSIIVTRYRFQNEEQRQKIVNQAYYYLQKQVPFDNEFNLSDSTQFFCTEFIWNVFYYAIGADLYEHYPQCKGMTFAPFWDERNFKMVLF